LVFGLFGPLSVWRDGRELELGTPQQRALLAVLLLHRDRAVAADELIDALWSHAPPRHALQVVRTYVSRLRAGPLPPSVLTTRTDGYRLHAASVDADRFETLLDAGTAQLQRGDVDLAESTLARALQLVRGVPLPELQDYEPAERERRTLEELRLQAEETLNEAQLEQGRDRSLIPRLREAIAAEPLRERLHGQLMVALYRSGRQADALAAYRAAHVRLREELGVAPDVRLRELERLILAHDPVLATPSSTRSAVPRSRTSFLGRHEELAAVEAALAAAPLVTITGTAGVGKTRLAAELAARTGPVWWVELGSVSAGRALSAIGRAVAVPDVPGRRLEDLVLARLDEAAGLLVLDNCEHLLDEVGELVARLMRDTPRSRLLATSREPFGFADERICRLTGLATPPAGTDEASLLEWPAARLFADRARAAKPGYRLDGGEASRVCELVRRVDGLPLAIELAASSVELVSTEDLAHDAHAHLAALGRGPHGCTPRHRTLEAAIAWSFDLLDAPAQGLFRRLAVFPTSFDLPAATAVAGDGGSVVAGVAKLAAASLVVAEPDGSVLRYRLLQTVRTFALERLREAGEEDACRLRHRDAYTALAEEVDRNMHGAGLPVWLPRARREHENFDAALRWSLARRDGDAALRLASALAVYWFRIGAISDGRRLLEQAIELAAPGGPARLRATYGRARLAQAAGTADALRFASDAVAAGRAAADRERLGLAICIQAQVMTHAGRGSAAALKLNRARPLFEETGSEEGLAYADQLQGCILHEAGDLDGAAGVLERARDRFRQMRGDLDAGYTLVDLARVRLDQRRPHEALAEGGAALADFRRRQDPRGIATAWICLGRASAQLGRAERAREMLGEALALSRRWELSSTEHEAEHAMADLAAASS
jgi:predicted ATPase